MRGFAPTMASLRSQMACLAVLLAIPSTLIIGQLTNVSRMLSPADSSPDGVPLLTDALQEPNHTVLATTSPLAADTRKETRLAGWKANESYIPDWIEQYFEWHRATRIRFPGSKLFTDPDAPKILVRACPFKCGGLHDRIGQLPWDLYIANQTKRVLLFVWHYPSALEDFLEPSGPLNWTVPHDVDGFYSIKEMWNMFKSLPAGMEPDILSAVNGSLKDEKVLLYTFLGHLHEPDLEERLRSLGSSDGVHQAPIFGNIFRAFFKPSARVASALEGVKEELNLANKEYSGVHCRVRHPKNFPVGKRVRGKGNQGPADRLGLDFTGWVKDYAVSVATHAIQCVRGLLKQSDEPVLFFSDTTELVEHIVHDLKRNVTNVTKADEEARRVVVQTNLVARRQTTPNVHLDRQKDQPMEAYTSVFVDMFLAMGARCLSFGVGNFGYFATKVSGTSCRVKHRLNEWGGQSNAFNHTCSKSEYNWTS